MSENRSTRFVFYCLLAVLGFCLSTTAVNGADILFISAMDPAMMPGDDALKAFMESLGHTVTYFDDNESEAATEAAAAAADLVFISESVGSGNIRNEITEIQTPMIITEAWGWDEMGLTSGGGAGQDVISTDIQIVAPKHVLAAGLSGTVPVLTDIAGDRGPARLGNGIAGREATVIARATLTDGQTYDVVFIYEKGAALPVAPADGSAQVAADMRICLGFDEHSYLLWNENAYALLRAAIRYALGMIPQARSPYPLDGAIVLATWTELRWSPGDFAATHDVYLGEDFDDVNNGAPETFRGNQATMSLLVGFPGYPYPDGLVPGTTYYWRIDEVNDADPNSPWKGPVWSFSIPPRTAYNPNPTDGAEFVDLNAKLTWTAGFDAKFHTVYFGDNFDDVNSATAGTMAATPTYNPGPLKSAKVYYWRVDESDPPATHKGQVWSFTTPVAVGNPHPSNGAAGAEMNAILAWTPSDNAASHRVYFGTDKEAVRRADMASPEYKGTRALGAESYDPGLLAWNGMYYWRVDEVDNAGSPSKGPLWSFTTGDYLLVDDFESYNDLEPPDPDKNRIFDKWLDGFGTTTNGAIVGNDLPPYAEQTVVRGGAQSMPYAYDTNLKSSEATLTLVSPRDWTAQGVTTLSLWSRGGSANAPERLYIALASRTGAPAVAYYGDVNVTTNAGWTNWVIPLQTFADLGVNLADVDRITIGFGTRGNTTLPGGTGQMYFDDIRLYRPRSAP